LICKEENEMTKEQPFEELEKIRDAMSEAIIKLKNDEITIEEANTFTRECGKRLKEIEKKLKELKKRK
jgi:exonuclease VII small subunit